MGMQESEEIIKNFADAITDNTPRGLIDICAIRAIHGGSDVELRAAMELAGITMSCGWLYFRGEVIAHGIADSIGFAPQIVGTRDYEYPATGKAIDAMVDAIAKITHPAPPAAPAKGSDVANAFATLREAFGIAAEPAPEPAGDEDDVADLARRIVRRAQYDVLRAMRDAFDKWDRDGRENHEGLGHRDRFEACCASLATNDAHFLIESVARTLGVPVPPRTES